MGLQLQEICYFVLTISKWNYTLITLFIKRKGFVLAILLWWFSVRRLNSVILWCTWYIFLSKLFINKIKCVMSGVFRIIWSQLGWEFFNFVWVPNVYVYRNFAWMQWFVCFGIVCMITQLYFTWVLNYLFNYTCADMLIFDKFCTKLDVSFSSVSDRWVSQID